MSAFEDTLEQGVVRPVLLLRGEFSGGPLRLWNGYGDITPNAPSVPLIHGQTYTGAGTVLGVSPVESAMSLESRRVEFSLEGISSELIAVALVEDYRGRPVWAWMSATDAQGTWLFTPRIVFAGRMDVMRHEDFGETANFVLTAETRMADVRRVRERRWTDGDQRDAWPDDASLVYVARLQNKVVYWGRKSQNP